MVKRQSAAESNEFGGSETEASATEAKKPREFDTSGWNEAGLDIDGWYNPETTGKVVLKCRELVTIPGSFGDQDTVKCEVMQTCMAVLADDQKVQLEPGQIIAVRLSSDLSLLAQMVANECLVEITPGEKVKTRTKGRSVQKYKLRYRGKLAEAVHRRPARVSDNDDNLPF
ncbi:MAG TPA: hypothetical protein VHL05_12385 [Terriglobales bacterium]|jgi:hypothetical protein|nr:hypothetical protein [Terriglobales bacterium]